MSSSAHGTFRTILARADLLCSNAAQIRKKAGLPTKIVLLHAALANQVAAWDAYVKALSLEYFSVTAGPTDIRFSAMHDLLKAQLEIELIGLTQKKLYIQQQNVVSYYNWHPLPHEYT